MALKRPPPVLVRQGKGKRSINISVLVTSSESPPKNIKEEDNMDVSKTKDKLKEKLPRVRKQAEHNDVLKWMWKLGAKDIKSAVRTKQLEEKVLHAGAYLKNLKRARLVEVLKKSSAPFLLDHAATGQEKCFLHTYPEIKEARKKRSIALVDHVQSDHELLILSLHVLGLDEKASIVNVLESVEHNDDQEKEKTSFKNYNNIVKKFKEKKVALKGYEHLEWKRGGYSWYLSQSFIAECF